MGSKKKGIIFMEEEVNVVEIEVDVKKDFKKRRKREKNNDVDDEGVSEVFSISILSFSKFMERRKKRKMLDKERYRIVLEIKDINFK